MMEKLITITSELNIDSGIETDGHYELIKAGHSFRYEGMEYTYHSSGLARSVYISGCGKFVIKVPVKDVSLEFNSVSEWLKPEEFRFAPVSVHHNFYEAEAYEKCPEEFKVFLAKTELLPNCWVRQEFVSVINCGFITNRHDLREIGKREDGTFCIFDFDPLLSDFVFSDFDFKRLPKIVNDIELKLSEK